MQGPSLAALLVAGTARGCPEGQWVVQDQLLLLSYTAVTEIADGSTVAAPAKSSKKQEASPKGLQLMFLS